MDRYPPVLRRAAYSGTRLARLALLIPGLLLLPSAVSSQSLLDRVMEFYESASGFYLIGEVERGDLSPQLDMEFSVVLMEGSDYLVAGFCHSSCENLDLALLDSTGEEVAVDDLPDAEPLLAFTAGSSGRHRIRVAMKDCSLQSCPFAVGVFVGSGDGFSGPGEHLGARMDYFRAEFIEAGYVEEGRGRSGSMNQDGEVSFPLALQIGAGYRVVGICDSDCGDLDLVLLDPSGAEVDADRLPDPTPLLVYEPSGSGEYRVSATMAACDLEPCAYQIAIFRKGPAPFVPRDLIRSCALIEG